MDVLAPVGLWDVMLEDRNSWSVLERWTAPPRYWQRPIPSRPTHGCSPRARRRARLLGPRLMTPLVFVSLTQPARPPWTCPLPGPHSMAERSKPSVAGLILPGSPGHDGRLAHARELSAPASRWVIRAPCRR